MRAILGIDPSDPVPIWKQIEDGVRRLVAAGRLPAGTSVPSVRELARDLRVNPATVSKAYRRLTDDGVLVVHRGEGTFVAERTAGEMGRERRQLLGDGARGYRDVATFMGASLPDAVELLTEVWDESPGGGA